MNTFIVFAALFAVALATPIPDNYVVSVQQDTSGQYKVVYDIGEIARTEERLADGSVKGYFTYVDGDGKTQKIVYTSGEHGFQVSGTNLPVAPSPVEETAEVQHARHEHLTAYEEIKSKLPVEYTGEEEH